MSKSKIKRTIYFCSTQDAFGEFSNFAHYPIVLDKKTWKTTEHYFQAQKFVTTDPVYAEKIRNASKPMQAAQLGRSRKKPLRKDWESIKVSIMAKAVWAKFTQHEILKKLLLSTEDAKLVEHTSRDSYWGNGGDGSGKNMLGQVLMKAREKLSKK